MRRTRATGRAAAGTALIASLALVTSCTSDPAPAPPPRDPGVPPGQLQLVAFDSCADALTGLRSAATAYVGPFGFGGGARAVDSAEGAAEGAAPAPAAGGADARSAVDEAAPGYSGTNTHEVGVDEPDLVKTDGRRIVTVDQGVLRVVDPAGRRLTGSLELGPGTDPGGWAEANLLLHGDRALVLVRDQWGGPRPAVPPGPIRGGAARPGPVDPADGNAIAGPRLILVDLAGAPKILGEYRIDGALVDARQVGATARVVIRSAPRLAFPYREKGTDATRVAANREIIGAAAIDAWLPRYETTAGGQTSTGRVGCDRLSRPATYSGTSMVTVLSFDLGSARLGDGDPVTVVADGDTVYSNGPRLYVASDQRWRLSPGLTRNAEADPKDETTQIFQFDTSGTDRPRYVTAASVPGWLVNQYALSEWNGHLRVATTTGDGAGENPKSSSAVYVLRADGRTLTETGRVTGLGKGERIYSVRFAQGIGYVVTFRQTDPLYSVDLRDPKAPKVTGELKITGYSAYLHPIEDDRLVGVGQEASSEGSTQGTQISLFDVSDLGKPTRIAQHHVRYGHSEAEFDPHAFLYWPATGSLVVPLTTYGPVGPDGKGGPNGGALVLRVTDGGFAEVGTVNHAEAATPEGTGMIRRSLVIDGVLWTVSDAAIKATDLATMGTLGVLRT